MTHLVPKMIHTEEEGEETGLAVETTSDRLAGR